MSRRLIAIRRVDSKRDREWGAVFQAAMRKLDGVPGATLPPFSSSIRTLFQRFATLFYLKYVLDSRLDSIIQIPS